MKHLAEADTYFTENPRTVCGAAWHEIDGYGLLAPRNAVCDECTERPELAWPPCHECGARFDGYGSRHALCPRCFAMPFLQ